MLSVKSYDQTASVNSLPIVEPTVRIAPGSEGVSIWSSALFGLAGSSHIREFLTRVFSVEEVVAVEIRRSESFGRVRYDSSENASQIWRKISRTLLQPRASHLDSEPAAVVHTGSEPADVEALYLNGPPTLPIRVNRVGQVLSTWRLRHQNDHRIRLTHPILLNRKDVAYRLEEELTAILGVEEFRTNTLSASLAVRFDPRLLTVERLIRQLEKAWPRLLEGLEGPPSGRRFAVAGGLLGLSYTGQYLVPPLKPLGLLGVTLYGLPNVRTAARQAAHRQVGLPALYSFGLGLMLVAGRPFSSSVKAVLMQLWPRLSYRTMTKGQRRLFAIYRQRATWARLIRDDGIGVEVDIDKLASGDLIAVHEGETIPVDGVVTEGLAAVDEEALSGAVGALDKTPGDPVFAATFVRDGRLMVRVGEVGIRTVAGHIGLHLPHSKIDHLLSSAEAERIANRNAKPALALAAGSLVATRSLHPAEAIARPDYATGPRLSAQLTALHGLGDGLRQGIFFRDPTALDRLTATDIYVFDDTAALDGRPIEVAEVFLSDDVSADEVIACASAGFPAGQNERAHALWSRNIERSSPIRVIFQRSRHAGVIRYLDSDDRLVELAAPAYISAMGVNVPVLIAKAVADSPYAWSHPHESGNESVLHKEPFLRPLWVLRDGEVLGVVTFRREGEPEGVQLVAALKARNKRARFVYISRHPLAEATAIAEMFGIPSAYGGLDPESKAAVIKELGGRTMWIGDGTSSDALPCIEASTVSISVAGFAEVTRDVADIVLLKPGLQNLVPLRRIGRAHRARIDADYRATYVANLLGTAGGFLANFGSLEAGLTSNVGTGFVYARRWKELRDLISDIETRRALTRSPSHDESDHLAALLHAHSNDSEQFVDYQGLDPTVKSDPRVHGV